MVPYLTTETGWSMTPEELKTLKGAVCLNDPIRVVVNSCAVCCCGRSWTRRDGYRQTYWGRVNQLSLPEHQNPGSFVLFTAGIGTTGLIALIAFDEVEEIGVE